MDSKELKKVFGEIAKTSGFESAFGGWFKDSAETIIVLDLQKSNFGDYYEMNIKIYIQGMFGNSYSRSKDLVKVGWHQNHVLNLKKLPVPFHGNHPAYNTFIINEMRTLRQAGNLNLSTMQNLQYQARQLINQAYKSGGTLNSYFVH